MPRQNTWPRILICSILDILETVVLIRMLITIKAAQTNPGRQAVELFNPQLPVVIDGIQVAIHDIANATLTGIHPDRRAIAQYRQHTVATHRYAFGLVGARTPLCRKLRFPKRRLAFSLSSMTNLS